MYFATLKSDKFIHIDTLKDYAKQLGFKYRFDYRMKRWELYCPNAKATKKKIKLLKEYATKNNMIFHDWIENKPKYKDSVYKKR